MDPKVDALVRENANLTRLFTALKPSVRAPITQSGLALLREYFRFKDEGFGGKHPPQPDALFVGAGQWPSYYDWFTRALREDVLVRLRASAGAVAAPTECVIESVGALDNMRSIVRLKKPAPAVKADLATLGVPASHLFLNAKLLTSHYHYVHAPVAGVLRRVEPVHASMPLFGRASLNFVEIEAAGGSVFLLVIGEAVVQDFVLKARVGERLAQLDPIGHFAWGSQVVTLFPGALAAVQVQKRQYMFVGERVI